MSLPEENLITIEKFYKMREETDSLMEYIDGIVLMTPSPSTQHQRVSGRLHASLYNLLKGEECEVFHAPFDVELRQENMDGNIIVIPDLCVISDKSGLQENKYVGAPTLIIEILSPSNQAHDLVFKLNIYMQYGVKEYWIVNPMLHIIQVYTLNEEGQYQLMDAVKGKGITHSKVLPGFQVNLEELFDTAT